MPNRQAQCSELGGSRDRSRPYYRAATSVRRTMPEGILTLALTSFNPPPFNFYGLLANFAPQIRAGRLRACPDGRLHHLGNSPASVRAKVMGRLFFLESYCVTQPLTPRRFYQRLFCVPSCRIFTFVSGHCWLPMRGDGFSMAAFFMSGGLNSAGSRLKEFG